VKRYAYLALVGSMVLAILFTESRGGLLGLVCDTVAMTFLAPIARRGDLHFGLSKSKVMARAVLLVLIGVAAWYSLPDSGRARLNSITSLGSDYNTNLSVSGGRMAIWTRNLPLVLNRPWGYGAGAFDTVDGLFAGGRYKAPHNIMLEAVIEVGIPGLAVLIALIVSCLRYLHIRFEPRHEGEASTIPDEPRAFARALGVGLIGLCVSGFFLSELYASVFWTLVTLSCAVGSVRRGAAGSGEGDRTGGSATRVPVPTTP
jgi:O-antigen ligase